MMRSSILQFTVLQFVLIVLFYAFQLGFTARRGWKQLLAGRPVHHGQCSWNADGCNLQPPVHVLSVFHSVHEHFAPSYHSVLKNFVNILNCIIFS